VADAIHEGDLSHVIVCPACGELVPVAEAETHEHFAVRELEGTST
jgi:hypothetical protein